MCKRGHEPTRAALLECAQREQIGAAVATGNAVRNSSICVTRGKRQRPGIATEDTHMIATEGTEYDTRQCVILQYVMHGFREAVMGCRACMRTKEALRASGVLNMPASITAHSVCTHIHCRSAQVTKCIRRCLSRPTDKKHELSPTELKRIALLKPHPCKGAVLWAYILIAWGGMLRKSNTKMGFNIPMDPATCILISNVKVNADGYTMRIEVRNSSNLFSKHVHVIHIAGQQGGHTGPP